MLKNHPKGLLWASLANMGERFGFYIMMGVLLLFLQAKFGLDGKSASTIYSIFYASVYVLALVGGLIADNLKNYKGTILTGLVIMTGGYVLLGVPGGTDSTWLYITYGALGLISFGNGLFKGNLQALVGRMYENDEYRSQRDSGFSLFYMFINVGAIFAPLMAVGIRNWWLQHNGFAYDAGLPSLCHAVLKDTATAEQMSKFTELATKANHGNAIVDATEFATQYLGVFNTGFHYAFWAAVGAMLVSLLIYVVNKASFPADQKKVQVTATTQNSTTKTEVQMAASEIKQRILALCAVFAVVIFFWMSFHQNGVSLTLFARDYIDLSSLKLDLGFTSLAGAEVFQSINPLFVVTLTPVVLAIFSALKKKGKEPSTPMKIVIGMFIAALAFVVMLAGSLGLPTFKEVEGGAEFAKVTPWLMVLTYLVLTVAELFISPLGISFVSKVAPPHLQGIMQGLWLCATAVGNSLLFVGTILYESLDMYLVWACFAGACIFSMLIMLSMVKWLERVAK
ncbi:MAG: peptide MFS transporter [Porphyromonadaceae bacterium]|nr:peptide MFS transporter [Porphyromonadaceae bacterium]